MNEVSLFSGAGGGLLGTKKLGFKHICYIEYNDYCQRVIAQRIKDRMLDNAPIYGDIRAFIDSGRCELYRGVTDIITAGFPCQGWSAIGKQAGEKDPRNLWPETAAVIDLVRPPELFLENSTRIISTGYIYKIIEDLAALGYVGHATRLSGLHTGENSKRERAWIKAKLSNTISSGLEGWYNGVKEWKAAYRSIPSLGENFVRMDLPDPGTFRADYGASERVDRLTAIGNCQYPSVAAAAFHLLAGDE